MCVTLFSRHKILEIRPNHLHMCNITRHQLNSLHNRQYCHYDVNIWPTVQFLVGNEVRDGEIRLNRRSGNNLWEGRVEIFLSGEWGTVCDNGAASSDAQVVCRQLGYHTYSNSASVINLIGVLQFLQWRERSVRHNLVSCMYIQHHWST